MSTDALAPTGSPLADRLVIVLGAARSGTTWLQELLCGHPAFRKLAWESSVFRSVWDIWENAHRPDGEGISAYLESGELAAALRTFCDDVLLTGIGDEVGSWIVDKTPGDVNRLAMIADVYPDAWYINLVRDGRDVARSHVRTRNWANNVGAAAHDWVWSIRAVERHRWRLPRFRRVRYEDLLADPVGRTRELLEWMGLTVDESVGDRIAERRSVEVARYGATEPIGSGKWRDLSAADLELVERVAGPVLAELGYL
jgi:hypothetical protein